MAARWLARGDATTARDGHRGGFRAWIARGERADEPRREEARLAVAALGEERGVEGFPDQYMRTEKRMVPGERHEARGARARVPLSSTPARRASSRSRRAVFGAS